MHTMSVRNCYMAVLLGRVSCNKSKSNVISTVFVCTGSTVKFIIASYFLKIKHQNLAYSGEAVSCRRVDNLYSPSVWYDGNLTFCGCCQHFNCYQSYTPTIQNKHFATYIVCFGALFLKILLQLLYLTLFLHQALID